MCLARFYVRSPYRQGRQSHDLPQVSPGQAIALKRNGEGGPRQNITTYGNTVSIFGLRDDISERWSFDIQGVIDGGEALQRYTANSTFVLETGRQRILQAVLRQCLDLRRQPGLVPGRLVAVHDAFAGHLVDHRDRFL